ncbi:MAG: hypothetical protein WD674_01395 [Cucumibacter sp.]
MIVHLNRRQLLAGGAALAAASPLRPFAGLAQGAFPAGETIEVLSGGSDGSSSNILFQSLTSAMGRLNPGTRFVFRTNPGGTTALTAAMIAEAAPDGLTIGTVDIDSLIAKATGADVYDVSDFAIIGSMSRDIDLLFATTASGIASLADLQNRTEPAILPVRSTSSGAYFQGHMLNALLGTRILPVTGYDAGARDLAFVTGEAQVSFLGLDSAAQALANGTGVPILKTADGPLPAGFGDFPPLSSFDVNPAFGWIVDYLNVAIYTQILVAPKQTTRDRVEILRSIFLAAAADPALVALAEGMTLLDPVRGDEIESALVGMMDQLDSFPEGLNAALACGKQIAETGGRCTP